MKRARLLPTSPGSMRVFLMTLAGMAMTLVVSAACTNGGSTQSDTQPISTAYPSFGPSDGVGTCGAWRTLSPSQQAGILPWMYATIIQSEFDIPKYPYPREKYLLKLTKNDVARGVAIIDARCKPYGDDRATAVLTLWAHCCSSCRLLWSKEACSHWFGAEPKAARRSASRVGSATLTRSMSCIWAVCARPGIRRRHWVGRMGCSARGWPAIAWTRTGWCPWTGSRVPAPSSIWSAHYRRSRYQVQPRTVRGGRLCARSRSCSAATARCWPSAAYWATSLLAAQPTRVSKLACGEEWRRSSPGGSGYTCGQSSPAYDAATPHDPQPTTRRGSHSQARNNGTHRRQPCPCHEQVGPKASAIAAGRAGWPYPSVALSGFAQRFEPVGRRPLSRPVVHVWVPRRAHDDVVCSAPGPGEGVV